MDGGGAVAMRPRILHVGCGTLQVPFDGFDEVSFDADPSVNPDILGDMTAMGDIGQFDAIWCCHSLEHVGPEQALKTLSEFLRVLKPGGFAAVIVPDLEGVSPTFDVLPGTVVNGHDLIYGTIDVNQPLMMHRTGFVADTLKYAFEQSGFRNVVTKRLSSYNLMGVGVK